MENVGLMLMDLSLKSLALDRGAAAILDYPDQPGFEPEPASFVPREILDVVQKRKTSELPLDKKLFRTAKNEYTCRAYLLESPDGGATQPIVALLFEKVSSPNDALEEICDKYNLTRRERDVVRAMSMGLPNAEMARGMNISPNTLKSFLRLIMLKMGVKSRLALIAKLLENDMEQQAIGMSESFATQRLRKLA
jgi:DNA-binding CsgD family transcriptional regulator